MLVKSRESRVMSLESEHNEQDREIRRHRGLEESKGSCKGNLPGDWGRQVFEGLWPERSNPASRCVRYFECCSPRGICKIGVIPWGKGFSRQTDREFAQFLYVAKGSVSEVQSQLYVALDLGYLSEGEFAELYKQADEVARLISGFTPWNTASLIPWGEYAI